MLDFLKPREARQPTRERLARRHPKRRQTPTAVPRIQPK